MKHSPILLLILLCAGSLTGCRRSATEGQLMQIDSLMLHGNDSVAHVRLQALGGELEREHPRPQSETGGFSERDRAYYHLLNTLCGYRLHLSAPSDSIINGCLDYYRRHNNRQRLALALCNKAFAEYHRGNRETAFRLTKEAEQLTESNKTPSLAQLEAPLFLSLLNSKAGLQRLAVDYGKEALRQAERLDNRQKTGYCLNRLAMVYNEMGKPDSMNYYMFRCEQYLPDQLPDDLPEQLTNLATAYLQSNNPGKAEELLNRSIEMKPLPQSFHILAEVYAQSKKDYAPDELWIKALEERDTRMRIHILTHYANQLERIGEAAQANRLNKQALSLRDTLLSEEDSQWALALQENLNFRYLRERDGKTTSTWLLIIGGLLAVFAVMTVLLVRRLKRARQTSEDYETQIRHHEAQVKRLQRANADNNRRIAALQEDIGQLHEQQMVVLNEGRKDFEALLNGGDTALWKTKDYDRVIAYYAAEHPDFMARVKKDYRRLTPSLTLFLILTEEGFGRDDIQRALALTEGAYRTMKYRVGKEKQ